MTRTLALLATLLLAGCAAPAATTPGADGTPDVPLAPVFSAPVATPVDCRYSCYEPSIARDAAGRLVVADGSTADLAVSEDGGATWSAVAPPKAPGALPVIQSDVLVQASPSGRLYYSALLVRSLPTGFVLEGIQVAWSEDGGATWPVNAYLSPLSSPLDAVYHPDRQWLGFGEGETMYLTYNQIPSGIWLARSDDGGKTWGGWVRAAQLENRRGIGQSGPPVVDGQGRVLVSACAQAPSSTVAVFASDDGGRTFQRRDVTGSRGCSWFPVLAAAPDGGVVAAWHDGEGGVHASVTRDGGETWSAPTDWGEGASTSPWPLPEPGGGLALAWIEGSTLRLARGTPETGPSFDVEVAKFGSAGGRTRANTDFAHGVLLPEGGVALTWADTEEKAIYVAREA